MMKDRVDKVEIISPVQVPGNDTGAQRFTSRWKNLGKVAALTLTFIALVGGGTLLLLYLSKNPVHHRAPEVISAPELEGRKVRGEAPLSESGVGETATLDLVRIAEEKEEAEQRLADFVRAQKVLEDKGAAAWGGDAYERMAQLGREADASFLEEHYMSAALKYAKAAAKAEELTNQTESALGRLLDEASLALAEGDSETAQQKFTVALLLDPANESAQRGLKRAKNFEAVMALLTSAKGHEQNNNLSFALTDYQEALRLDPESQGAREGFGRVKALIAEEKFQQFMSAGLTAYHNHDYQRARSSLLKAQTFRPDSDQVRHALAQVNEAIRLARLENLRKKAVEAEQSEDWRQALEHYLAVLEMDPQVEFAIRGRNRSLEQIRTAKRINFYLERPSVLESQRHLANAELLLEEVEQVEPRGGRLAAQIEKLHQLVAVAQRSVKVTLVSDNLTKVAVYRVGKLGQFDVHDLYLRPGTYTVVGVRDGYQDFRKEIVVKPGQQPLRFTVICRIKI